MTVYLYALIFIGSCILLIKSGTWVIRSLTRIAQTLQWSEFLVTFFIMAFATSLPEFFVGLNSAFHKVPQLSFGNIIGANMLNLTIGIAVIVFIAKGLKLETKIARTTSLYTAFFVVLPLLLMLDGKVSRFDGIVLLIFLFFYIQKMFYQRERFKKVFDHLKSERTDFRVFFKDLLTFIGSIALLVLSAEGIVRTASFLALEINLPIVISGIFFVSIGTVLPELSFGIKAIRIGHKDMALGDFMGTVIINSTLILGIVSIISPLKVNNFSPYIIGILFTFVIAILFAIFAGTGRQITRKEAVVLILIYIAFIACQILIS